MEGVVSMQDVVNSALRQGLVVIAECFPVSMTWGGETYTGVNGPKRNSAEMLEAGIISDFDLSLTFDSNQFETIPQPKQSVTVDGESYAISNVQLISGGATVNVFLKRYS